MARAGTEIKAKKRKTRAVQGLQMQLGMRPMRPQTLGQSADIAAAAAEHMEGAPRRNMRGQAVAGPRKRRKPPFQR